jgi:chromosome segregation ATPase
MNNKLQEIKERVARLVGFENASDDDLYYMSKGHINWLISQAEKVEQLQKQLERKEQALEEMFQNRERWRISQGELEAKLEQQHHEIEQLKGDLRFRLKMLQKQEKDLMKVCEERDRLKQQLQQAKKEIQCLLWSNEDELLDETK